MTERQASFVPLPCAVIDDLLPTLKDTELRLLVIVLRQTWGWRGPDGKPKARDWLSHRQLKERTGRASEAVSAAIDALVRRGLVRVQNEQGDDLSEARQRRRLHGRLYFCPGPLLVPLAVLPLKTEGVKAKTTTQALAYTSCPFRNSEAGQTAHSDRPTTDHERGARVAATKQEIRKRLSQIG